MLIILLVLRNCLAAVHSATATGTWLWDSDGIDIVEISPKLEISRQYSHLSFIRLQLEENILSIDLVNKGTNWPAKNSFCKEMLPATILRFLVSNSVEFDSLHAVQVVNLSEPREIGCRCYVRVMVSMGFNEINDEPVTDDEIPKFCRHYAGELIVGRTMGPYRGKFIPPLSKFAERNLLRAKYTDIPVLNE